MMPYHYSRMRRILSSLIYRPQEDSLDSVSCYLLFSSFRSSVDHEHFFTSGETLLTSINLDQPDKLAEIARVDRPLGDGDVVYLRATRGCPMASECHLLANEPESYFHNARLLAK